MKCHTVIAVAFGVAGCGAADERMLPGGATTVVDRSPQAFSRPAANLSAERSAAFFVGNSFFKTNWVIAPASTGTRDGLGPLFNAPSCSSCHLNDGRGRPPVADDEPFLGLLLRIGMPAGPDGSGDRPDPVYGDQIQTQAIPGVPREGTPRMHYEEVVGTYTDGTPFQLRRPQYRLEDPGYGPFASELRISPRVAPAVIGAGLLENVPDATLLALADEHDRDADGISGRPNRVRGSDGAGAALGRFGWKAGQPTVEAQVAAAFVGDIGITSTIHPEENASAVQHEASRRPSGGSPEIDAETLDFVTFYTRTLAVPARRDPDAVEVRRGQELFRTVGCAGCHIPRLETGVAPAFPELSRQVIHPYTDLLLHDLGAGLADGRPEHDASGSEWRTPPLWGIGLLPTVSGHSDLLHDGRARDVAEAILWHGGEAQRARDAFAGLDARDRAALVAFVEDL
jgi:CxxC motif-containing protein (DUF1111 family)